MRVLVETPSRLHFGLIDLNGSLGRIYGSVGVALNKPKFVLELEKSSRVVASGERVGNTLGLAKEFIQHYRITGGASIKVKQTVPEHSGLGSETQFSLALAAGLARLYGVKASVRELAEVMGRGRISGVGVGVFEYGGFIIDSGRKISGKSTSSQVIFHHPFPKDWVFTVVVPETSRGLSGRLEDDAFRKIIPAQQKTAEKISHLILMKLIPNLIEEDILEFGSALTEVNHLSGSYFRKIQGGIYRGKTIQTIVEKLPDFGAYASGQSSWGPAVYGLTRKKEADRLEGEVREFMSAKKIPGRVFTTTAENKGARINIQ